MSSECASLENRILVVDDEEGIRDMLGTALELSGYGVVKAQNGKEALAKLAHSGVPCVIFLDLMMPVMNGWEFADALARDARWSSIPIVVVSAFPERAVTLTRAKGVLGKPLDLDALLRYAEMHCGRAK
jgi:CheY-like chemotaxis protein